MKRNLSTATLFILLLLTVVAINQTDMPKPTALGNANSNKHETN